MRLCKPPALMKSEHKCKRCCVSVLSLVSALAHSCFGVFRLVLPPGPGQRLPFFVFSMQHFFLTGSFLLALPISSLPFLWKHLLTNPKMALFAVKEEQLGDLIPAYAFIWPEVGGIF